MLNLSPFSVHFEVNFILSRVSNVTVTPEHDYHEESDYCAESECEDSRKTEITCTGPACGQKVKLKSLNLVNTC
jgi:hypothetical protein